MEDYIPCLAYQGQRLKWAYLIKICPLSVVVVCVIVAIVVNFSHFHVLFKKHWAYFNQTLHKESLGKGFHVCVNERSGLFQRVDNCEWIKEGWGSFLKNQTVSSIQNFTLVFWYIFLIMTPKGSGKNPLQGFEVYNRNKLKMTPK